MELKFKVGDKVKVTPSGEYSENTPDGKGVIVEIRSYYYHYKIEFPDQPPLFYYREDELEKVDP